MGVMTLGKETNTHQPLDGRQRFVEDQRSQISSRRIASPRVQQQAPQPQYQTVEKERAGEPLVHGEHEVVVSDVCHEARPSRAAVSDAAGMLVCAPLLPTLKAAAAPAQ